MVAIISATAKSIFFIFLVIQLFIKNRILLSGAGKSGIYSESPSNTKGQFRCLDNSLADGTSSI